MYVVTCPGFDVAAFAVQNGFEAAYGQMANNEVVALINVGASLSNINILAGGTSAFTRDVTTGGNSFTDDIKRHLGVSGEEARRARVLAARELQSQRFAVDRIFTNTQMNTRQIRAYCELSPEAERLRYREKSSMAEPEDARSIPREHDSRKPAKQVSGFA